MTRKQYTKEFKLEALKLAEKIGTPIFSASSIEWIPEVVRRCARKSPQRAQLYPRLPPARRCVDRCRES